jgi:carboxyl-terminal processing protease
VRDEVMATTRPQQEPFVYGSLGGRPVSIVEAPVGSVPGPPIGAPPSSTEAAQAWSLIKDTTNISALEAFIRRFGDTFYGDLAKARVSDMKQAEAANHAAETAKKRTDEEVRAKAEVDRVAAVPVTVSKLFGRFNKIFELVQKNYVEKPDHKQLIATAIQSMSKAFPIAVDHFGAGQIEPNPISFNVTPTGDLNDLYHAAMPILEAHKSNGDDVRLVDAAIKGTLGSLDPRSYYLDPKRFSDAQTQSRGQFGGVGIELRMVEGLATVVATIDDSPAARAGVVVGDIITHLDNEPLHGLNLDQIVHKMRGPVNTSITLTIVRKGKDEAFNAKLVRDVIRMNAVKARLADNVVYVKISTFNEQTHANLVNQVENLKKRAGKTIRGYVLDLRNNSGGLFDQAIAVADDFVEKGEIVLTKGRNLEETQRFNARPGPKLTDGKPIVVLINGASASASEIIAGALQDHKRATIVGTRSFGLGSIQTLFPLGPGEGALRLTTSRYFTPSGRSIHAKGIVPDVEVLQDVPEDIKARGGGETKGESDLGASQSYVPPDPHEDKALIFALEIIRGTKSNLITPMSPR